MGLHDHRGRSPNQKSQSIHAQDHTRRRAGESGKKHSRGSERGLRRTLRILENNQPTGESSERHRKCDEPYFQQGLTTMALHGGETVHEHRRIGQKRRRKELKKPRQAVDHRSERKAETRQVETGTCERTPRVKKPRHLRAGIL